MAKYIENFKSKLDWSNVLQRTAAVPLDRTELFESLADATLYAQGGADSRNLSGTSYIGQIVVVHENDAVTAYIIENKVAASFDAEGKETNKSTRTLKELAGAEASAGDVESALQKLNDHITAYNTKVKELENADKEIMGELGEDEERAYASLIELERALKKEVTDRGTADSGLQNALNGEIARAEGAEGELQQAIATEKSRATTAEKGLEGRLDVIEGEDTVTGSIKKAVADLRTELLGTGSLVEEETQEHKTLLSLERAIEDLDQSGTDEANARIAADTQLAGMLGVQITAEGVVTKVALPVTSDADGAVAAKDVVEAITQLDARLDKLQGAETVEGSVAKAVADEAARADAAEKANTTAIATEKGRAEGKEKELQVAINGVQDNLDKYKELMETTLKGADKANSDAIKEVRNAVNTEATTRGEEITRVEGLITTEKTRAEGEEAAIRKELANEKAALKAEIDADVKVVADELAKQKDPAQEGTLAKQIAAEKTRAERQEAAIRQEMADAIGQHAAEGVEASGLRKEMDDAVAAEATIRKNKDDALDGRLQAVEASIGNGGNLEGRVAANEAKLAGLEKNTVKAEIQAAQTAAEKHADDAITELVNSAPEAMNTLKELADAITKNQGIYDAWVEVHEQAMADMKKDLQDEIDADVKVVADELAKQKDPAQEGTLAKQIAAEKTRAEGAEEELQDAIDGVQNNLDKYKELMETTLKGADKANSDAIKEVRNAVDAEATTRRDKDKELEDAIKLLNGNAETEGSVAKAVAAEAKSRKEADTALDEKITTLRTDTVAIFNALELVGEEKDSSIEISLVLNGGAAMNNVTTPLGTVALDVMTDEEVSEMLTTLGLN